MRVLNILLCTLALTVCVSAMPQQLYRLRNNSLQGTENVLLQQTDTGRQVTSTGYLGKRLRINSFSLRLGNAMEPEKMDMDLRVYMAPVTASAAFTPADETLSAQVAFSSAGNQFSHTVSAAPPLLVIPDDIAAPYLVYAPWAAKEKLTSASLFVPPNKIYAVKITTTAAAFQAGEALMGYCSEWRVQAPAPYTIRVYLDKSYRLVRIDLPGSEQIVAGKEYLPASVLADQAEEQATYVLETVKGKVRVTVHLPREVQHRAILLIPATGPFERDNKQQERLFSLLRQSLLARGFPLITYAAVGIPDQQITLTDTGHYCRAALNTAMAHPRIKEKAFVLGYSDGALSALSLYHEIGPRLQGLVLLAPPARPIREALIDLVRLQCEQAGVSEQDREHMIHTQRLLFDALATDKNWQAVKQALGDNAEQTIAKAKSPWFTSFLSLNVAQLFRNVHVPALLLYGKRDMVIQHAHSAQAAQHMPPESIQICDTDHSFMTQKGLAPDCERMLTDWLLRHDRQPTEATHGASR